MNSWLKDNVSSIIALVWNLAAVAIFILLIKNGDTTIKDTIENIVILILGFYFGSTRVMNERIRKDHQKDAEQKNNNDNPQ